MLIEPAFFRKKIVMKFADLSSFDLFKNVPLTLIAELLPDYRIDTIPVESYLVKRGVDNHLLYLLLEGDVAIYLDERDPPLKVVSTGEIIGEISLTDKKPATATVVALTECKAIILSEELVWQFFYNNCFFAKNYLLIMSSRFRCANNQVISSLQKQRVFEHKSNIDHLTQLYNRGWLNENFDDVLERCKNESQPFSYCMIDIDYFKKINDTYGHQAGDLALQVISSILKNLSRTTDYVVRYGGEEIAILLPNMKAQDALVFAERIRKKIEHAAIEYEPNKTLSMTISIGVSTLTDKETSRDLIKLADEALYFAKGQGRNQVEFNDESCR